MTLDYESYMKPHNESFSTQIAYPVEKIKGTKTIENWEIISKGDIF